MKVFFYIIWNSWAIWSRFYQWLERTFMDVDFVIHYLTGYPPYEWSGFCIHQELEHYGRDKWYMAWDVISLPQRSLARKKIDCDDFALLGYEYFGESFEYEGKTFKFHKYIALYGGVSKSHAIAVWLCSSSYEYFVINNDNAIIMSCLSLIPYFNTWLGTNIKYVGEFDITRFEFEDISLVKYKISLDKIKCL